MSFITKPNLNSPYLVDVYHDEKLIAREVDTKQAAKWLRELTANNSQAKQTLAHLVAAHRDPTLMAGQLINQFGPRALNDVWMNGLYGQKRYPFRSDMDTFSIYAFANALAMKVRFGGQIKRFFSVAEHCVLLSHLFDAEVLQKQALLHEGDEDTLPDFPGPVKDTGEFAFLRPHSDEYMTAMFRLFDLPFPLSPAVKAMDQAVLDVEAKALFYSIHPDWSRPDYSAFQPQIDKYASMIEFWSPEVARDKFLARFVQLFPAFPIDYPNN